MNSSVAECGAYIHAYAHMIVVNVCFLFVILEGGLEVLDTLFNSTFQQTFTSNVNYYFSYNFN